MLRQGTTEKRALEKLARQSFKFNLALRQGLISVRGDRDIDAQSRHWEDAVASCRQKEFAAKQVLMRHGLFPTQFMPYFRFVRYLGRAARLYQGEDFRLEAGAAAARWAGQGCDARILAEILWNVFNVRVEEEPETRSQNDEAGAEFTTKTQRHQEDESESG
jgi:hypothetical protein